MPEESEPSTCPICSGVVDPDVICPECLGQGSLPIRGVRKVLKGIINEQVSQREDLTAALQAIWNKVKDL
uniref:Uncharacterized protein n=1 Tax=viral metagenome TaxID=1070528 RepID=A0A6M3LDL0_9ZZZZ